MPSRSGPSDKQRDVFSRLEIIMYSVWRYLYRHAMPLMRYIFSYIRAAKSLVKVILSGSWNVVWLAGSSDIPGSIAVNHIATGGDADLTKFAIRLASTVSADEGAKVGAIDLILVPQTDVSIVEYVLVARCFGKLVNIHIMNDACALKVALPTAAVNKLADGLREAWNESRNDNASVISTALIGSFSPPLVYRNLARDFYKTFDPYRKYCVISDIAGWPLEVLAAAGHSLLDLCPEWCFVVIGDSPWSGQMLPRATENMIWPTRSGMDFRMQLSLAFEADAYIGPDNLFALAAILSGKPVTLLANAGQRGCFEVTPGISSVRVVKNCDAATLDREIKMLVERVRD